MSVTLDEIRALVKANKVRASDHGIEEMLEDDMDFELLLSGAASAEVVEDYPDAFKGPSVLVLQNHGGRPVHVVWGLSKDNPDIATLITAYFPKPERWYDDFRTRQPK